MLKKVFLFTVAIFIILAAIITIRTITWKPLPEKPMAKLELAPIKREPLVEHLSKAIQFKTISTRDGNQENAESFRGLHQFLRETYPNVFSKLEVKDFPSFGLLLKWPGSDSNLKPFMLMAHQDVVPLAPGSLGEWKQPPFSGAVDQEFIWGRGSMDDKASLIGIFEAAEFLLKENFKPKRTLYLFFSDNEELAGATAPNAAKFFKDSQIQLEAVVDEGGFIISDLFPQVSNPVAMIGVAEKGYLDVELSNESKGGHSSVPPEHTTIGIVSSAIQQIEAHPFPRKFEGISKEFFESLSRSMKWTDRIFYANLWLFEPYVKWKLSQTPLTRSLIGTASAVTVFNAGEQSNVLPPLAKAVVNLRLYPNETMDSAVAALKNKIHDPRVTLKILRGNNPSPVSSLNSKTYESIVEFTRALYPNENLIIAPYLVMGATDSRWFAPVADNVYRAMAFKIDTSDLSRLHGVNERLSIENLENGVQFYILLMKAAQ